MLFIEHPSRRVIRHTNRDVHIKVNVATKEDFFGFDSEGLSILATQLLVKELDRIQRVEDEKQREVPA